MGKGFYEKLKEVFFYHYDGLADPSYLADERDYKVAASTKALNLLGQQQFENYLQNEDYQAIINALGKICQATNLINWRDYDFLKKLPPGEHKAFCQKTYALIFEDARGLKTQIDDMAAYLEKQPGMLNSNIWNFVTYILFLFDPVKHYFVKPSVWSSICKKLDLKNPKTAHLNGTSYENILELCRKIIADLKGSDLEPRDFIDLQSILYIYAVTDENARRYWVFKLYDIALWKHCREEGVAAMQYQYGKEDDGSVTRNLQKGESIKKGDYIVAALSGKNKFLGYGLVTEELFEESNQDKLYDGHFGQRIGVEKWEAALEAAVTVDQFEETYAVDKLPYNVIYEIREDGFDLIKERLWGKAMEKAEYRVNEAFNNNYTQNVILEGPPGTGKTFAAHRCVELGLGANWQQLQFNKLDDYSGGSWEIVQFHPNYSFEDFVRGLVAEPVEQGVVFTARDKIFARMCRAAINHPHAKFYLIIDEINRGDLSKILGELIYALEYRGSLVSLLYEVNTEEGGPPSSGLVVPANLFIIGTMNTADRSIALVDYAIRRRFAYFRMQPDRSVIESYDGFAGEEVRQAALSSFDRVQAAFEGALDDFRIGHTYFLVGTVEQPGTLEALNFKFRHQVLPLLEEYSKEGILETDRIRGLIDHE